MPENVWRKGERFCVPAGRVVVVVALAGALLFAVFAGLGSAADLPAHLGYGFNLAQWDTGRVQAIGFDWAKVFDPPGFRMPVNVLLRVPADAGNLSNVDSFGDFVENTAAGYGAYIEAYEIGNEVNLDASYGWNAPPVAADYVTLLCEAYGRIKQADPDAIVVSAGLAPTGRVTGNWDGHAGHNGQYQDEREYLREFIAAGGAACADVIGYHPYGFSADYDAAPDLPSADPTQNCTNGFCFRGAEIFYQVMAEEGIPAKKVWATEFGWIVEPPAACLSDPSFQGREWQLVTEAKQASNLAGAYAYADAHWPWMGAMFIFNLNFNVAPWIDNECEQMRYYAVQDRPAEVALTALPKRPAAIPGRVDLEPAALTLWADANAQPVTRTATLWLQNGGWQPLTYTAQVLTGTALTPLLSASTGMLNPTAQAALTVTLAGISRPVGLYTGTLLLDANPGTLGVPVTVPVSLHLLELNERVYLPAIVKE